MRTIGQVWDTKDNNFDVIRLAAAAAVIVSHAFFFRYGLKSAEPLIKTTGHDLGWHAVNVFFVISGFLVLASYMRRQSLVDYALARAARIFPALIAAALVTTFAIGAIFTRLPLVEYLSAPATWTFPIKTVLTLRSSYTLPGLFEQSPANDAMGTVWTLKYETICYAGLALAAALGLIGRAWAYVGALLAIPSAALVLHFWPEAPFNIEIVRMSLRLSACFVLGMAAYHWRYRMPLHGVIVAVLFAAAWMLKGSLLYEVALYATQAYGTLWLAFVGADGNKRLRLPADYSYGIYLYGYPVQQAIHAVAPEIGIALHLTIAFAVTVVLAALSWHIVEKPFIRLKARPQNGYQMAPAE